MKQEEIDDARLAAEKWSAEKLPVSRQQAVNNLKTMAIAGHYEWCLPDEECGCQDRIRESLKKLGATDEEIGNID